MGWENRLVDRPDEMLRFVKPSSQRRAAESFKRGLIAFYKCLHPQLSRPLCEQNRWKDAKIKVAWFCWLIASSCRKRMQRSERNSCLTDQPGSQFSSCLSR